MPRNPVLGRSGVVAPTPIPTRSAEEQRNAVRNRTDPSYQLLSGALPPEPDPLPQDPGSQPVSSTGGPIQPPIGSVPPGRDPRTDPQPPPLDPPRPPRGGIDPIKGGGVNPLGDAGGAGGVMPPPPIQPVIPPPTAPPPSGFKPRGGTDIPSNPGVPSAFKDRSTREGGGAIASTPPPSPTALPPMNPAIKSGLQTAGAQTSPTRTPTQRRRTGLGGLGMF